MILFLFNSYRPVLNGIREPDRDYYNDLPGKLPPESQKNPFPHDVCSATLPNMKHHHSNSTSSATGSKSAFHSNTIERSGKTSQQWAGNPLLMLFYFEI